MKTNQEAVAPDMLFVHPDFLEAAVEVAWGINMAHLREVSDLLEAL